MVHGPWGHCAWQVGLPCWDPSYGCSLMALGSSGLPLPARKVNPSELKATVPILASAWDLFPLLGFSCTVSAYVHAWGMFVPVQRSAEVSVYNLQSVGHLCLVDGASSLGPSYGCLAGIGARWVPPAHWESDHECRLRVTAASS